MKYFSFSIIFFLFPFFIIAQTVLSGFPEIKLTINANNLKKIVYHNEEFFLFDNYISDSVSFCSPDSLPDGKYIAFYNNDTSRIAIKVSYLEGKRNGQYIHYHQNGTKIFSENFKIGILCEQIYYCSNGTIETLTKYKNSISTISKQWDCLTGKLLRRQTYSINGRIKKDWKRKK